MTAWDPHETTIAAWLREHRGILVRTARSFGRDAREVAELQQEMAYQLWLSLARFAGEAKVSTWIYRVCLNTALTWRRGVTRREGRVEAEAEVDGLAAAGASPAESAEQRERLERLYAALRELPGAERALVLLLLDGLSYREMAEVTGMTENHVGVALTRARRRLAQAMKGANDELE